MSRYIIGVLNEFLLNKKANERMHAIGSPFLVAHKATQVVVMLCWMVAGQTIVLAIVIFHARVKDERKYRRCLTHHCAVVRCRSVHSNFTIAGGFKFRTRSPLQISLAALHHFSS